MENVVKWNCGGLIKLFLRVASTLGLGLSLEPMEAR